VIIDGNRVDLHNQGLDPVGGPTAQAGNRTTKGVAPATTDVVTLSDDARLMRTAIEAAGRTPDIRDDVVERMRAALDRGEIGNDFGGLADALIDSWAGER